MSNKQKYGPVAETNVDGEAIAKLLAEHGILIDMDDPIFRVLLANKVVLDTYFSRSEAAFIRSSGRLRKNATAAIMEAERVAVRNIQTAGSNIVHAATKDVVEAVRAGVKEELSHAASSARLVQYLLIAILCINIVTLALVLF